MASFPNNDAHDDNDEPAFLSIRCDGCKEWFHTICLGITKYEVQRVKNYVCALCAKKRGIKYHFRDKPPNRKAKLTGPKFDDVKLMLEMCPANVTPPPPPGYRHCTQF